MECVQELLPLCEIQGGAPYRTDPIGFICVGTAGMERLGTYEG